MEAFISFLPLEHLSCNSLMDPEAWNSLLCSLWHLCVHAWLSEQDISYLKGLDSWAGSEAGLLPASSNSGVSNLVSFGKLFNYSSPSGENYLIIQLLLAVAPKSVSVCRSRDMMKSRMMKGVGFNPFPSRKQTSTTLKRVQDSLACHLYPEHGAHRSQRETG